MAYFGVILKKVLIIFANVFDKRFLVWQND